MSWFGFTGSSRGGDDTLWNRIFSPRRSRKGSKRNKRGTERNGRSLRIDELESRCLLSVTPSDLSAVIVNQTFGAAQSTTTSHSVASDNNGDFVVTWSRISSYTDAAGTTYPVTNAYARYYTDTVQQVNLPAALTTTGTTAQPTFSLRYNDQTIQQISVTAAAAPPAGDFLPPTSTNIQGTFNLWFNATGSDTLGQLDPTTSGGTQSDELTVNYNEIATYVNGVETAGPASAAQQIQQWLNAFAPVAANAATGFAGSDATHAIVNAIDPHTFVIDYGIATQGLDQSSLLQYVSTEAPFAAQLVAFSSTAGSDYTFVPAPVPPGGPGHPQNIPIEVGPGTFALQVGTVQTAPINFDSAALTTTATNMQTALVNAGFTGATVTAFTATSPFVFDITFPTAEPPVQYVPDTTPGLPVAFVNLQDASGLTGFLPSVTVSTLDKPFTITNIPFSQNSPTLTAEAIAGAFQASVDAFSTGVAPINFVSLEPYIGLNGVPQAQAQNPYTAPIYNNVGAPATANTPVTGWNPSITVQPVVTVNTGTTDTTSFTSFDITFTNVTGTTVDAPMVVTNYVAASGAAVSGSSTSPLDGTTLATPGDVAGASVSVVKQSGNEFQVNPPEPYSIYTENQQPLNSTEPAVAMDGSGDFVISWTGQVSQQLAPKDTTNIYFRMYSPVGVTAAGTAIQGAVMSDLYGQQQLSFDFTTVPSSTTDTFELALGSFVTAPITFSTDPATLAASIQAALSANPNYAQQALADPNLVPVTVTAASTGNPFNFDVTFNDGGTNEQVLRYVATTTDPLWAASNFTFSTSPTPANAYTGVRVVTNPTQSLTFDFTAGAPTATGSLGTFKLLIGTFTTAAISFDSNPTVTALNLQRALSAAGFPGIAVSAPNPTSTAPTLFTFNVTFTGYDDPVVAYQAITLPSTVAFINSNGDPYTIQANANYTNPQFQSDVAMDPYGNFVIVWANQGPDESYFNDISMQCFDNDGNPLGNQLVVDQDPGNPAINYNTDTNFSPSVAIGLNDLNPNVPITDSIVVSWTTAIELPQLVATDPFGSVYARGYSYNPEQKQGPAPLAWNQLELAGNGGLSSVSMDGQNNFIVAWQQHTDPDVSAQVSEGIYAAEYQIDNYNSGAALNAPRVMRNIFRVNSASTNTLSTAVWPFNQEAADVQMTISGDIVTSFQGYGPEASDNISVPSSFFTSDFAFEQQQLTFNFVGGIPTFTAANDTFELQVGSVYSGPIIFSTSARTTAAAIQTALVNAGFTGLTVTGSLAGNIYTFKVTFGANPDEPNIIYAGALPATVTFTNSVTAPAAAQQLTFSAASVPVNGIFELTVGTSTTAPIYFDSTSPTNTAANIQAALINAGFAGTTVTVDATSTTTSFVFDVTFAASEAVIQLTPAPTLPTTLVYGATTTTPWLNADLLNYFNPLVGGAAAPIVGVGSASSVASLLYADFLGSINGILGAIDAVPATDDNYVVNVAIDKVLFQAEYAPTAGTPAATQTQLGRLRAILESVAGLLRGDANGILTSQWDANATDSQNSTYSDNIVSTQRDGQDQTYYLVVPYDVQNGTFQLQLGIGPVTESPGDVVPPVATTLTTGIINMPSIGPNVEPGAPIDPLATAEDITNAINTLLGTEWGQGSVLVRTMSVAEANARTGTDFQVPTTVYNAADPTFSAVTPTKFITTATKAPAAPLNTANAFIFELIFEGQAHDIPITVALGPTAPADEQWIATKVITTNTTTTTTTFTYAEGAASPPAVIAGDYTGIEGSPQYDASLAVTSTGSMVVAYTNQSLQTDLITPAADANGNNQSNIYYNALAESTDIGGPHIVGWTDGNGVDLLNAPRATAVGVNAQYMVLTFDEPMLADNPANDPDSIYNAANYQIYNSDGNLLSGVITHIDYGLGEVSQVASTYGFKNTNSTSDIPDNKWEVVLTLDDVTNGGPLPDGTYTLKILAAEHALTGGATGLCNLYGTPLNLTGYNQPTSVGFQSTVTINKSSNPGGLPIPPGLAQTDTPTNYAPYRGGLEIDPAVSTTNDASNTALNGNYVVVWTSQIGVQSNIVGQMYKASGVAIGGEFLINTTASTTWGNPDVAMDAAGDFIVVWAGAGPNTVATDNTSDIFGRAYNATGQALTSEFLIDQYVTGVQQSGVQIDPRVAESPDGTFVVTWTSTPIYTNNNNVTSYNSAIFAREYDDADVPLANEFQVTPSSANASTLSDVAMDSNDDFVVTWEGDFQNASTWGVYGDYFTSQGRTATTLPTTWTSTGDKLLSQSPNTRGSFTAETTDDLYLTGPRVAMDPSNGTAAGFVVTWANFTSPTYGYSIFAQQFGPGGVANSSGALNTSQAIMVNPPQSQTGAGWQLMPAVGVDPEGDIAIAWTTYGQDNANNGAPGILDYGIYADIFYSSISGKGLANTNTGEFRVNATTLGDQVAPAVTFNDFNDDALVAWVGPDPRAVGTTAIFDRDIDPPNTPAPVLVPVTPAITAADATVAVGAAAAKATFTISLSSPTANPVTVYYSTANGTAKSGVNYTAASGSVTFAPGQVSKTVAVNVAGLTTAGPVAQNFQLNLASPVNATVARAAATGTITLAAPTITVSPSDTVINLGQAVTFHSGATGTPTPTVQWQLSTTGGLTYSSISGATATSYTFTPTVAMSGDLYRAVFTNTGGATPTTSALLTIHTVPVVTGNPGNRVVNVGVTVSLTVAGSGTPTPTVQWQFSTDGGMTYTNITGATSLTYTMTNVTAAQAGLYRAVFTNSVGTADTTPASVTVHTAPVITTNPTSHAVNVNTSVTFTAAATGTPTPTVQWQVSSTKGNLWTNISGATSTSYTVTATSSIASYMYRAVFTNSYGLSSVTSGATLAVNTAPVLTSSPASQAILSGASVTFTAAATGTPTPTVQWQVSLASGPWANISGATATSYTLTGVTQAMSGNQYRAVFTNSVGTVTSAAAKLSVNSAPVVSTNPVSQSVVAGTSVTFSAAATGYTSVQWQVSTNSGGLFSNISGAAAVSYTFKAAITQTGYQYRAVFTNSSGTATTTAAALTVSTVPVLVSSPASTTVTAGTKATFTASATGTPTPTVQWQMLAVGGAWTNISGATAATYTIASTTAAMAGNQYRAVFTNSAGSVTSAAATLSVNYAPVLKTAPTSQTVSANHSVTFTAAASGTPTPKVQWQVLVKGGSTWTNITGATSASYTFTATAAQTGYQYRAVFTNSLGSLTTAAATLTVTAAVPVVPVHASTITTPTTNLDNTAKTAKVTTLSAPAVDVVLTLL